MKTCALGLGLASIVAATASADITGAYVVSYSTTAEDFGGTVVNVFVQDLYLKSNDSADVALNVFNFDLSSAANAASSYFQSSTSTGWLAQNAGGIFDNDALRQADSFVTIGGVAQFELYPEQVPGAGEGTGLDPNFGGNTAAAPGAFAGWYNGNPPTLNGSVGEVAQPDLTIGGLGVMIGRFATTEAADIQGGTLDVTWNKGLGTDGSQGSFVITPAPGALALLGLAGMAGRRRRG